MCYSLLGMKAIGCVYDISHVQWQQLNSSAQLRRRISRTQILVVDTIAEHLNTVLGIHDMACFKYGWSCGNDSNFDDGHMGLLGEGTLRVIEQIDATPMCNLLYPRYGSATVADLIEHYDITKLDGLLELEEFDDVDQAAKEFVIARAREVARVRAVGAALAAENPPSKAKAARRASEGSTAAQHDHTVHVAQPAATAGEAKRRLRDGGDTQAQLDAKRRYAQPAMTKAESARHLRDGDTAAQLEQRRSAQPVMVEAENARCACEAAASGKPLCRILDCGRLVRRGGGLVARDAMCLRCFDLGL